MKLQIFSVFDAKTGIFAQPNFMVNKATALRSWSTAATDPSTAISKHPGDYHLFHIGEFDDDSGQFTNLEAKIDLGTALEHQPKE